MFSAGQNMLTAQGTTTTLDGGINCESFYSSSHLMAYYRYVGYEVVEVE